MGLFALEDLLQFFFGLFDLLFFYLRVIDSSLLSSLIQPLFKMNLLLHLSIELIIHIIDVLVQPKIRLILLFESFANFIEIIAIRF